MKTPKEPYIAICVVCGAEHEFRTKKEQTQKLNRIWSKIRKLFIDAYNNLFIYGSNKL